MWNPAASRPRPGHVSGGTLSFVSKSGTNQFHGSAFEFLRNQDLDARGFFNSTKSIYKQNDFGVTAGGPVYLPKLYNGKNKTFFFASYEGFRNRVGAGNGTLSSVPPPEFYTGDLHNWVDGNGKMYQIYDPGSQTPGQRCVREDRLSRAILFRRTASIRSPCRSSTI